MAGGCNKCGAKATPDGDRLMKCLGECKAKYCSKECQQDDWMSHKLTCANFQSNKCWICKKSSREGSPLYRACACRGDDGFAHLDCLIRYAKIDQTAYNECHRCQCAFDGEIFEALQKEMEQECLQAEAVSSLLGNSDGQIACKLKRGKSLSNRNERKAALECFEEVLEYYRVKYGEEDMLLHKDAANAAVCIAGEKTTLGYVDEALELLRRIQHFMFIGSVSADWKEDMEFKINEGFINIYNSKKRYEDALPYAERNYELCEGDESRVDAKIYSARQLWNIYGHLGEFEKALPLGTKIYKMSQKAYGSHNPQTKEAKKSLEDIKDVISVTRG